jgi:hypothetical protein
MGFGPQVPQPPQGNPGPISPQYFPQPQPSPQQPQMGFGPRV